ncbi:hypothetical protein HNP37_003185 [Flavobacterium nitrogenifigens]|uniref:Lipoprotein n=2 Tax=Flavobacterium TaxID=237 RepID=A0A7W7IZ22_9FLAO|nr:hypothetical protein [Flavobacterium notoginsengisoli]MBB4803110.1 hypothetical protein [Flavobacterium nitrogenifigens]MBB6388068.1 hypothetical protein [Flavobacterium notoginsengisoli]
MKKILTLFAVAGLMAFSSCSSNDDDNDTISEVFQVRGVSFTPQNDYNPIIDLNPSIFPGDMVLVYRQDGSDGGAPVWKMAPELYYFADGTLDFGYNFNFTVNDVSIYMDGNDLASVSDQYRLNQTFRIVIIPGYVTGAAKSVNKADYSDYNAVIARYGIDDSKVKEVKVKN